MSGGVVLGLSLAFAFGDWIAVGTKRRWLEYLCKPLTLLGLTLWFVMREPVTSYAAGTAFAIGLGFSLLGDVLLMLPSKKRRAEQPSPTGSSRGSDRLRQGLAAFFAAHLAYIVAFNRGGLLVTPASLAIGAVVALATGALLRVLLPALETSGRGSLRLPVVGYSLVLGFMAWSAVITLIRGDWILPAALPAAAGGGLFFLSDSALAVNRFLRPLPGGRLFEHVSYHVAQFSMAIGMALYLP